MNPHHLAQINIGTLRAPVSSPEIAEFVANLDQINALAEAQPGFVWRLVGAGDNATDIASFENPLMAINMSTWTDAEALAAFVYRCAQWKAGPLSAPQDPGAVSLKSWRPSFAGPVRTWRSPIR